MVYLESIIPSGLSRMQKIEYLLYCKGITIYEIVERQLTTTVLNMAYTASFGIFFEIRIVNALCQ